MAALISLREVTSSSVRAVTDLRVTSEQERYVASNAVSIAEAYFHREAWFRAVFEGEKPAGFVMLRDPTHAGLQAAREEVSLWRFMIDAQFQGKGIGRKALELVFAHLRMRASIAEMHTSYVVGPASPLGFYLALGFTETGEVKQKRRGLPQIPLAWRASCVKLAVQRSLRGSEFPRFLSYYKRDGAVST